MNNPPEHGSGGIPKVDARAAGAGFGGGTLLAVLASNLSDAHPWKSWLVILAPSVSVTISTIWTLVARRIRLHQLENDATMAIQRSKDTLRQRLRDKNLTDEQRRELMVMLDELNMLEVHSSYERALVAVRKRDQARNE